MVSEATRAVLEDVSQQLTHQNLIVSAYGARNNTDDAGGRILVEATHTLSQELQDHQTQTEKSLDASDGVHVAGDERHLQAEVSQQLRQMESTNKGLAGLNEALCRRNPDDGLAGSPLIHGGTDSTAASSIHSLPPHMQPICPTDCRCACHATRNYGSWSIPWLHKAMGSLLVSYRGGLLWKTACTDFRCLASRTKAPRWLRASYTLPPWLLQMTLSVFVSPGPPSPELLLRVINQLPNVSSPEAFWNLKGIVERGDLEALKYSIAHRLSSVHDEHRATGWTALGFAIRWEKFDMVKILLHAGADPFQGPVSTAAVTTLLGRIHTDSPGIERMASLFSFTEIMEAYEYTDLHKIILGIHPLDASEAIARNPVLVSQVNTPTVAGFTPVHLAAIRGNTAQLAVLKQAGADLSFRTASKATALHAACTNQKASAARFILDNDMVADRTTSIGMTPLHCIASSPRVRNEMWAVADRLLELGADIDARGAYDVTPLMYAANANSPDAIAYLLSRGASIDARDADGDTALAEAIYSHSLACVRMLLDKGADVTAVNKYGRGPLHYLAGAGTEDMMDIFQSTGAFSVAQTGVDVKHAVDEDGLDATDILHRRPNLSARLREKFQRLLDSIPDNEVSDLDDGVEKDCCSAGNSSGDEYFDADES